MLMKTQTQKVIRLSEHQIIVPAYQHNAGPHVVKKPFIAGSITGSVYENFGVSCAVSCTLNYEVELDNAYVDCGGGDKVTSFLIVLPSGTSIYQTLCDGYREVQGLGGNMTAEKALDALSWYLKKRAILK